MGRPAKTPSFIEALIDFGDWTKTHVGFRLYGLARPSARLAT
jgi:hypothetical protein